MNFIETEIIKYEKRIKRINENPDPAKVKANKLLYEFLLHTRKEELSWWKEGRPFAYVQITDEIIEVMGIHTMGLTACADRVSGEAKKYFNIAQNAGFPDTICDRFRSAMGLILSGDFPPPSVVVGTTSCDVEMSMVYTAGQLTNCPVYFIDRLTQTNYTPISFTVDQLHDLIRFVEKNVPGAKYNEDKFTEFLEKEKEAVNYLNRIYEYCKIVPTPISGIDVFRLPRPIWAATSPKALEYFRAFHDEVQGRVERGEGAIPNEKLRIMWLVTGSYVYNLFSILEKRGASVPVFMWDSVPRAYGLGQGKIWAHPDPLYGRGLSPLEEYARILSLQLWVLPAEVWVKAVIQNCQEFNIDGLVYYQLSGCPTNLNTAKIVMDRVEKELQLPTLLLEGWMMDIEKQDLRLTEEKLEEFVDLCLSRKEAR